VTRCFSRKINNSLVSTEPSFLLSSSLIIGM
jgi:hypothetical protein